MIENDKPPFLPYPYSDFTQSAIAFCIVLGAMGMDVLVVFRPPPQEFATPIFTLITGFNTLAGVVAGYYFVSSRSSAKKDEARDANMTTMLNKMPGANDLMKQDVREAAEEAAPPAAAIGAPPAAAEAAPPVVAAIVPPVVKEAIKEAFVERAKLDDQK